MIHATAIVDAKAVIGENVNIGAYTIIYENVVIGDNVTIESFCEIGYPTKLAKGRALVIGNNSLIRSHSIFYEGSTFGEGLVTGHRVTVRELATAGLHLQIGTLCDFQGDCVIGDYVRTQSNVTIGKHSTVGNFVWLFPYVVLTNDPHPPSDTMMGVTIKDYAIVAAMSVILPGVTIREHSFVGAGSLVIRDVPVGKVVSGNPATIRCDTSVILLKGQMKSAYPWPRHFKRGYPDSVIERWKAEFGE